MQLRKKVKDLAKRAGMKLEALAVRTAGTASSSSGGEAAIPAQSVASQAPASPPGTVTSSVEEGVVGGVFAANSVSEAPASAAMSSKKPKRKASLQAGSFAATLVCIRPGLF